MIKEIDNRSNRWKQKEKEQTQFSNSFCVGRRRAWCGAVAHTDLICYALRNGMEFQRKETSFFLFEIAIDCLQFVGTELQHSSNCVDHVATAVGILCGQKAQNYIFQIL